MDSDTALTKFVTAYNGLVSGDVIVEIDLQYWCKTYLPFKLNQLDLQTVLLIITCMYVYLVYNAIHNTLCWLSIICFFKTPCLPFMNFFFFFTLFFFLQHCKGHVCEVISSNPSLPSDWLVSLPSWQLSSNGRPSSVIWKLSITMTCGGGPITRNVSTSTLVCPS
jgi:hypothetical protein